MIGRAIAAALGAIIATVAIAAFAQATPAAAFYWSSFDAEQAVENSDWGDARGVASVDCQGKGVFRKDATAIGGYTFTRFRCELENRDYKRIGFVTVVPTAPESFKTIGYIRARCN